MLEFSALRANGACLPSVRKRSSRQSRRGVPLPRLRRGNRGLSGLRRLAEHQNGPPRSFPRLLELAGLRLHEKPAKIEKGHGTELDGAKSDHCRRPWQREPFPLAKTLLISVRAQLFVHLNRSVGFARLTPSESARRACSYGRRTLGSSTTGTERAEPSVASEHVTSLLVLRAVEAALHRALAGVEGTVMERNVRPVERADIGTRQLQVDAIVSEVLKGEAR